MTAPRFLLDGKDALVSIRSTLNKKGAWRCAECGKFVLPIRLPNNEITAVHSTACVVRTPPRVGEMSRELASYLARTKVIRLAATDVDFKSIPVEKVAAFYHSRLSAPAVLVQSHWTVFLLVVISATEDLEYLHGRYTGIAEYFGVDILGLFVEDMDRPEFDYWKLSTPSIVSSATWITSEYEHLHLTEKSPRFNAVLLENEFKDIKVLDAFTRAFSASRAISSAAQLELLQDFMRLENWRVWAKDFVLKSGWEDILPHSTLQGELLNGRTRIWLKFCFVHEGLIGSGNFYTEELARTLVTVNGGDDNDFNLVQRIKYLMEEWCDELVAKGFLAKNDEEFLVLKQPAAYKKELREAP